MASEKITAIIDSVKELSVLELKELIDAYCEEFGVSAVAAAAPAAAGAAAAAEEEKTEFDVILVEAGAGKMGVIKLVKEITGLETDHVIQYQFFCRNGPFLSFTDNN